MGCFMKEVYGVIGGSEAYNLLRDGVFSLDRKFDVKTPFGDVRLFKVRKGNISIFFLSRHGEKRYSVIPSFVNYRANIYALKEVGVTRIFAWSGPGAMNLNLKIGEIVLPMDLIDETKRRDYTFFEKGGLGFIRSNPLFCEDLRSGVEEFFSKRGEKIRGNLVYVCTEGPRLETAAEIKKFKLFGGDLVGMTLSPEVFLARELEMCYCPICYITNYAEGVVKRDYSPSLLFGGMLEKNKFKLLRESVKSIVDAIFGAIEILNKRERICFCHRNMERYRLNGIIGEDWHTWF